MKPLKQECITKACSCTRAVTECKQHAIKMEDKRFQNKSCLVWQLIEMKTSRWKEQEGNVTSNAF